jgi:hypothetical protein
MKMLKIVLHRVQIKSTYLSHGLAVMGRCLAKINAVRGWIVFWPSPGFDK